MSKELRKRLCDEIGVSGEEYRVRKIIREEIESFVDEIKVDKLGNLIALKKGKMSEKKVLFSSHMDEVGLLITGIEDNGLLRFTAVGGIDPKVLLSKRVLIGKDNLPGVIGFIPIHLQRENEVKVPKIKDMRIDVGASSDKDLKGKIEIGDTAGFSTKYEEIGKMAKGKAFDDRAGCAVLMEVIKSFSGQRPAFDTYFTFVVQEETDLRGSGAAAYTVKPDVAFVFEGTTVGDNPELEEKRWSTHPGEGPAITAFHRDWVVPKWLFGYVIRIAEREGIPYQIKRTTKGGTDAYRIGTTANGIPSAVISIPCRYIHSPVSLMNLDDYANTVKLARAIANAEEEINMGREEIQWRR
ncbi:MAG: M42 family peptidase [Thermotoga sp.]|nr:MAG: M42 family peptidase [Thermotoga sp.]